MAGQARVEPLPHPVRIDENNLTPFFLKKAFSLLGILPLGVYVILHLYHNNASLSGPEAYDRYLVESRSMPFYLTLAVVFVYLPVLFHGVYGLLLIGRSRPNYPAHSYFRNLKYFLQRLSGIGLLLFIPAHVYKTKIETALQGRTMDFAHMSEGMHEWLTFAVYVLGITGVAFHLANGVWSFMYSWGISPGPQSQRRWEIASIFLFLIILALGFSAIGGLLR